ncbi:immunity repressor [Gordonia phage Dogfish]|nr:immunity repressor [Gordonia phage Dogfish]
MPTKRAANSIIGERVHTLMWRQRRTQKELGALLGVDQASISKRLKGDTNWSAFELAATAAWLGESVMALLPEIEVVGPNDDPDTPAGGAPTRARTWDLRITSPAESPLRSVGRDDDDQVAAA